MAKERKHDSRLDWPSGILTEEQIKKDARVGDYTGAIIYSVAFILICVGMVPWLKVATTVTLRLVGLLACAVILGMRAYKNWVKALTKVEFHIVEDTVKDTEVRSNATRIGARLSDAATRTPMLILEKHGEYEIDAAQIHEYYIPHELVHQFKKGEKVYMVYKKATNELLRLYRKKYWTLPEEGQGE